MDGGGLGLTQDEIGLSRADLEWTGHGRTAYDADGVAWFDPEGAQAGSEFVLGVDVTDLCSDADGQAGEQRQCGIQRIKRIKISRVFHVGIVHD